MKGLDTNVLARYLTQDDAPQAKVVDELFRRCGADDETLHIDDVVLCELVWVLRAAYRQEKSAIVNVLEKVLSTAQFSFEDRGLLSQALADFRGGRGDFADYVIGRRNRRAGCDRTVTFDRALKGSTTFTSTRSERWMRSATSWALALLSRISESNACSSARCAWARAS